MEKIKEEVRKYPQRGWLSQINGSITVWNVSDVTRWFPHITEFPRVK